MGDFLRLGCSRCNGDFPIQAPRWAAFVITDTAQFSEFSAHDPLPDHSDWPHKQYPPQRGTRCVAQITHPAMIPLHASHRFLFVNGEAAVEGWDEYIHTAGQWVVVDARVERVLQLERSNRGDIAWIEMLVEETHLLTDVVQSIEPISMDLAFPQMPPLESAFWNFNVFSHPDWLLVSADDTSTTTMDLLCQRNHDGWTAIMASASHGCGTLCVIGRRPLSAEEFTWLSDPKAKRVYSHKWQQGSWTTETSFE